MQQDVLICVNARLDFFQKYYTVPENLKDEVDRFAAELMALGEESPNAGVFEEKFVSSGLSARFNSILPRLTPVAQAMTAEQKQYSKQVSREVMGHTKRQLVKDIAADVADTIVVESQEEVIARGRQAMTEAGIFDDYTRATNVVEDIGIVGGFLKGLFGKKKD